MEAKPNENCLLEPLILATSTYLDGSRTPSPQYSPYEIVDPNPLEAFCLHLIIRLERFLYLLSAIFGLLFASVLDLLGFSIILPSFQNIKPPAEEQSFIDTQYVFAAKRFLPNSNLEDIIARKLDVIVENIDSLPHYAAGKNISSDLFSAP